MNPAQLSLFIVRLLAGTGVFLVGVHLLTANIEQLATGRLKELFGRTADRRLVNVGVGAAATALIQSSGVTTVLIVGFVNVGVMNLHQAAAMIMGANIGTTVTAWVLSLAGIDGGNIFVQLLKPSSFTPVLALIGIIFYMFCKSAKKKDTGMILLGFATLMFGMETMSGETYRKVMSAHAKTASKAA